VPEEVKEERWNRFMQLQQQISAERLQEKVGREIMVLIDEVDEEGAIGRSMADAPEIDGAVYLNGDKVKPGDIVGESRTRRRIRSVGQPGLIPPA
jgi:ribosomal protein S12 methylthiotransferase